MKNIYSNILKFNKQNLTKTIYYLKKNQIVALPTETVYGLAWDPSNPEAILKLYNLKNLPRHLF